ncbi:MAG TPA: MATE family efflux transporter [Candidatus Mcinerneyibacterium sp.]|nr:MATE family efflux transporter [Candidatus Mcinerneyibacterium sp.]
MKVKNSLIEGNIYIQLLKISLPIIGTSFIQMTYSLTDLFWIGKIGSGAVAAVGTAGFFIWLANAMTLTTNVGSQVTVSQSVGLKNYDKAKIYSLNSFKLVFLFSIILSFLIYLLAPSLMSFFDLGVDETGFNVTGASIDYLRIISFGLPFFLTNFTFTGIINGYGNTKIQFYINAVGLLLNMILDPLLILGIGFFPKLEVKGAALATSFSQIVVFIIFILFIYKKETLFSLKRIFDPFSFEHIKSILKIGVPISLRNSLFAVFAMILAKILTRWGAIPIAVQKIGAQVEALSWRTASGVGLALSTFVGQNFGAGKYSRIISGYKKAIYIISILGVFVSLFFIFEGELLGKLFFSRSDVIDAAAVYFRILGYSQMFMCLEIVTGGAFNGLGRTLPPSLVSIILTGMRIPLAILLSSIDYFGLNGVWWSISFTSVLKGIIVVIWFRHYLNKIKDKKIFV